MLVKLLGLTTIAYMLSWWRFSDPSARRYPMSRKIAVRVAIGGIAVVALIAIYEAFFTRNFTPSYSYCGTPHCVIYVMASDPSNCKLNPPGVRLHRQDTLQFLYPPGVSGSYTVHFRHNTFPVNDFPVGYPPQKPNSCWLPIFGCGDTFYLDPSCGNGQDIGVHVDH